VKNVARRMIIGAMVLFWMSPAVFPAYAAEGAGAPKAQLPSDVYDFGTVYEGPDVFQNIVIKNTGDADLNITRIRGG
jgi:hypothetical protein